jgi:hypothetical protein
MPKHFSTEVLIQPQASNQKPSLKLLPSGVVAGEIILNF